MTDQEKIEAWRQRIEKAVAVGREKGMVLLAGDWGFDNNFDWVFNRWDLDLQFGTLLGKPEGTVCACALGMVILTEELKPKPFPEEHDRGSDDAQERTLHAAGLEWQEINAFIRGFDNEEPESYTDVAFFQLGRELRKKLGPYDTKSKVQVKHIPGPRGF